MSIDDLPGHLPAGFHQVRDQDAGEDLPFLREIPLNDDGFRDSRRRSRRSGRFYQAGSSFGGGETRGAFFISSLFFILLSSLGSENWFKSGSASS